MEKFKRLLKDKNKLCKQYIKNKRKVGDYEKLLNTTNNIANTEISNSNKTFFDNLAEKCCDPTFNRKAYWGILKALSNWKKVPIIPPLFTKDHFVTNSNKKIII